MQRLSSIGVLKILRMSVDATSCCIERLNLFQEENSKKKMRPGKSDELGLTRETKLETLEDSRKKCRQQEMPCYFFSQEHFQRSLLHDQDCLSGDDQNRS